MWLNLVVGMTHKANVVAVYGWYLWPHCALFDAMSWNHAGRLTWTYRNAILALHPPFLYPFHSTIKIPRHLTEWHCAWLLPYTEPAIWGCNIRWNIDVSEHLQEFICFGHHCSFLDISTNNFQENHFRMKATKLKAVFKSTDKTHLKWKTANVNYRIRII